MGFNSAFKGLTNPEASKKDTAFIFQVGTLFSERSACFFQKLVGPSRTYWTLKIEALRSFAASGCVKSYATWHNILEEHYPQNQRYASKLANLRVPRNAGDSSTSWSTVTFSRAAVPCACHLTHDMLPVLRIIRDLKKCSRISLIRINWNDHLSGYAENPDNWIFLWK